MVQRHVAIAGVAVIGAGLTGVTTPPPAPHTQAPTVQLASTDYPLGDGPALINGGSGIPVPSQGYANAFDTLFLQHLGYGGTDLQLVTEPNSLYPFVPPGPFGGMLDPSMEDAEQIIAAQIKAAIDAGGISHDNPVVVTGYSQSAIAETLLMSKFADYGIDPLDVHFVMLGDESAPNGGILERFDLTGSHPVAPSIGITFSGAGPSDISPTDIYTYEYDGFADFPKYPINFLADLNAVVGIITNHAAYLGLTPEQIDGAIALPTSDADTLTDYYMIQSPSLPLLDLVRLIPVVGNPVSDLIQPDLRVLINLGYGSTTQGWSPGDADVGSPLGFLPSQSVLDQVPEALLHGISQGVRDAIKDLTTLSNYQPVAPETMTSFLGPLLRSIGAILNVDGTPSEIVDYLKAEIGGLLHDYELGLGQLSLTHTGIPPIDILSAALITLPQIDLEMFEYEWAQGNYLDAFGDPLAADVGISPLLLIGALGL